jgi:hypothetical protein
MSIIYLVKPKEVLQDPERHTCWAAALVSWLSVTPQSPASKFITSQEQALECFADHVDENGGLDNKKGFYSMTQLAGMNAEVFLKAETLKPDFLYSKLSNKGHLYIFFLNNNLAHASVIYGLSESSGSDDYTLGIMDPWQRGIVPMQPLSTFLQAKQAVVAWFDHTSVRK